MPVTGEDGRRALMLADAALESCSQRQGGQALARAQESARTHSPRRTQRKSCLDYQGSEARCIKRAEGTSALPSSGGRGGGLGRGRRERRPIPPTGSCRCNTKTPSASFASAAVRAFILDMKTLHIGLIGSGFMGKAHAWGYRNVGAVFRLPVAPVLEILADATPELAATAARDLGFARSTGNWRELLTDPKIDIVNITTPPQLHAEMALASIAAGKHTYLEKPMAPSAAVAKRILDAARAGRREDADRLQLSEEPHDRAGSRDRRQRRDRRSRVVPRHPCRGLHGRQPTRRGIGGSIRRSAVA